MAFPINYNSSTSYIAKSGNTYGHYDAADIVADTFASFKTGSYKTMMFQGQTAIVLNNGNPVELIKTETGSTTFYDYVIRRFPIFTSKDALDTTVSDIVSNLCLTGRAPVGTKAFSVGMTATVAVDSSYKTYVITEVTTGTPVTAITVTWEEVSTNGLTERTASEMAEKLNSKSVEGVNSVDGPIYSYTDETTGEKTWTSDKSEAEKHTPYETYPAGVYAVTINDEGDVSYTSLSNESIDCGNWDE